MQKTLRGDVHTKIPDDLAEDPWFKVVDMLQHNWAVIIQSVSPVLVVFYGDTRGIFDELEFESVEKAEASLSRNGFSKYRSDDKATEIVGLPRGEFHDRPHPNGPIYSSGRFWVS